MPGFVLGLVPARGGSKGIPGKNLLELGGRPLLEYTARAARESGVIDRAVLSTDSEQIAAVGQRVGLEAPFMRPAPLAQDETPMQPVIEHAIAELERGGWSPEIIVLLQPTSPLRRAEHIAAAVATLRETNADSVVSVVPVRLDMCPDYVMKIVDGRLESFLPEGQRVWRRQDVRRAYSRDGTVYAFWRRTVERHGNIYGHDCRPLQIAEEESLTLDSEHDLRRAEQLLGQRAAAR